MDILVVVDMQSDFIDGALGTAEAAAIVPKVAEKIKSFPGRVLFTRDTHGPDYLDTQEGQKLPVAHCIRGTAGWELAPEVEALRREAPIDKPAFASVALARMLRAQDDELRRQGSRVETVTLVGLCTDICVISNALVLKAFLPEAEIVVVAACTAGPDPAISRPCA